MSDSLETILQNFRAKIDSSCLLTDESVCKTYASDWTKSNHALPRLVLLPKTTEDVISIVKIANAEGYKLIPSGGRTGFSGGTSVISDEIVVSLERLNTVFEFNEVDGVLRCGAGAITEELKQFLKPKGYDLPIDLASRSACQIGGNVATNAGGLNVIKYGPIRSWVAGIRVVTGEGEDLDLQKNLLKDNSGYDLLQLFIASEGTLGIITEVSIRVVPRANEAKTLGFSCNQIDSAVSFLRKAKSLNGLTAFEMFDDASYRFLLATRPEMKDVFGAQCRYHVIVEFSAFPDWEQVMLGLLSEVKNEDLTQSAIVADTDAERQSLWGYREKLVEVFYRQTHYQTDISFRVSRISDFVEEITKTVATEVPDIRFHWFGHLGDGNLHVVVIKPEEVSKDDFDAGVKRYKTILAQAIQAHGGSFSAEHGVGVTKKSEYNQMKTPAEKTYHKRLKMVFDPHAVLNPSKIWD